MKDITTLPLAALLRSPWDRIVIDGYEIEETQYSIMAFGYRTLNVTEFLYVGGTFTFSYDATVTIEGQELVFSLEDAHGVERYFEFYKSTYLTLNDTKECQS